MNDVDRFAPILEEIEFLTSERRQVASSGPHLIIQLRLNGRGRKEILSVCLIRHAHSFPMKLSPRGRIFVDFMARHRHLSLTAVEIEDGVEEFYSSHRMPGYSSNQNPTLSRRNVKIYVQRTRKALGRVFREAGLKIDTSRVLTSERSEVNQTLYRLRCTVEWRNEDWEDHPKSTTI